jgi:alcohol dehydrogenase
VCGATAGYAPAEDLRYIWSFELQIIGSDGWTYEDQTTLMNMVVEGKLKPVIHSTRPLSETPQALEELMDRKVFGKSVLTVTD